MYTNAGGFLNKIDELKHCLLVYKNIDIVCISETHLNKNILDSELFINGYKFFRKDRNFDIHAEELINVSDEFSNGGGSIIYFKDSLNVNLAGAFSNKAPDSLAIEVDSSIGKLCIACVYRSPNLNSILNSALLTCINDICNESNSFETVLLGDFNLPDVSWETGSLKNCNSSTHNKFLLQQLEFMDAFNTLGLGWSLVNEITRSRMVQGVLQKSLLDQVLYTNDALVSDVKLLSNLGKSDHVLLKIELGISLNKPTKEVNTVVKKTAWSKVSQSDILNFSLESIDWNYSHEDLSSEEIWNELHQKLQNISNIAPMSRFDTSNRPLNLPWSNSRLKRMRKNKDLAWRTFNACPTRENYSYAFMKDKMYSDEEFRLKSNYEKKLTNNLKTNCKGFYSYLRNKRQIKTGIPTLERSDGSRTSCPAESAEVLAEAFSSVFVHEPDNLPDVEKPELNHDKLSDIDINFEKVKHELETLNCFKSYGPDDVHPKLLKSLADDSSFVNAVVELFRKCTDSGTLPQVWKSANLSALFKSGSKTDPLNYRPVSLTCILCKVYERILRNEILAFVEGRISPHQHGFVKGKSCLSNLLETMDCIMELLEEGIPVDVFYFDFKKAFDRVPHNRLILKLQCLGIDGKVLDVIKDFLMGRNFRVSVNGQFSSFKDILSGIPQGSVLGPLLFILFINDLPQCLNNTVKMFADDLKLIANSSDKTVVDSDLKSLEEWERNWLLEFNTSKCKVMHLEFNDNEHLEYCLDDKILNKTVQEKDLGVLTSGTLLWNDQIESCVSKANQMICWISRNLISREKSLMLRVYKTLIRPHLEYCVQLWNPAAEHGNWSLIMRIESVQRRFTRMIEGVGLLPYSERLQILDLTTLAERRSRGDLIEVYKASQGLSQLDGVLNFSRSGLNIICKPGKCKDSKINRFRRNFINDRIMLSWNKLPIEVKISSNLNFFKSNLEIFKRKTIALGGCCSGNFWEISDEVLNRIEGVNYLENKIRHNRFLKDNPCVAKKKFINIY